MKTYKKWVTVLLALVFALAFAGCEITVPDDTKDPEPPPEILYDDDRVLSDHAFALSQVSGTDALGRSIRAGDASQKACEVGLFYFIWLGQHPAEQKAVYDISKLEQECEEEIFNPYSEVSKAGQYHHWGEPLYGYYNSGDPWVLTRHVELFTTAGIDFLVFDTTNNVIYESVVTSLLRILDKFQKQGFAVPKVAFMTNTRARDTAVRIYNAFYAPNAANRYPSLWYSPNGKPLIMTDPKQLNASDAVDKAMLDLFEVRGAQWPDKPADANNFPWMSWAYPQFNHNGVMSVSVAQHTTARMSLKERNRGRGWDKSDRVNFTMRAAEGSNIQSQWNTVFAANANENPDDDVDTVFVTGWNEWIALKLNDYGDVYFVDNYNAEYSRDLEMDKTAYGDNFYMQLVDNVHKLKYAEYKHYKHTPVTATSATDQAWESVRAYPDFVGDAINRNYRGYVESTTYTDNTARHDIKEIKVASDDTYAYFRIECAGAIGAYREGDTTYMNIWIATERTEGYDYVINRTYGKLGKRGENNAYTDVADAEVAVEGNVLTAKVALADLGVDPADPGFLFKVSDHVDASDPMNFYIQGDCAPIGRLSYTFGYVK